MGLRILLNHLHTSKLLPGFIVFVFLLLLAEQSTAQHTRYVKPGGTGDGSSWSQASGDLQAMINSLGSGGDIWVAKGTYKPNRKANALNTITPNNRDNSFVLRSYVKIYGGFNGSETKLEQRDPDANVTVLSGDFNGNDIPGNPNTYSENAYHVVLLCSDYANGILLDGLTIRGGNANGTGAITVNTRTINRNWGGGVYISGISVSLIRMHVVYNLAGERGGGIYNEASSSTISYTTLQHNKATNGAGIYYRDSYLPDMTYTTIKNNTASYDGGGFYSYNSQPSITNALIVDNEATGNHGGGIYFSASTPVLTNVTLSRNKANEGAGIFHGAYSGVITSARIRNTIIYGNNKYNGSGSGIYNSAGSQAELLHSLVQGLSGGTNGNLNGSINPLFADPSNGNFRLLPISPVINAGTNNVFSSGTPDLRYVSKDLDGNPRFYNTTVDMGPYESQTTIATTRYVKAGGTGDGSSWAKASGNLQAIINASFPDDEVWVAAGEYQPAAGTSFSMKEGVRIYGGFAGTEQALHERNHRTHATVLKGNGRSVVDNSSNRLTALAVLDGFTLTGGNAQSGGGIYNLDASPTLTNLIIRNNEATDGGGIANVSSNPTITHIIISGNKATSDGGGIYISNSSPVLTNVLVSGNSSNRGGGIFAVSSTFTLTHATIAANKANLQGGGLDLQGNRGIVRNSIIYGNSRINEETGIHYTAGTLDLSHSLVQGYTGNENGNIIGFASPEFAQPLLPGLSTAGDYSLLPYSPAIDAGNNGHLPQDLARDLRGNPRIFNTTVDMGAFESQSAPVSVAIRYVKAGGTGNGHSWASASGDLQAMLAAAAPGSEVRVAKGTYFPTLVQNSTNKRLAFLLNKAIKVVGGYDAATGLRDLAANATILSGNIGNPSQESDNSYTVLHITADAELDGFTIRDGFSNGSGEIMHGNGAGVYNTASPIVRNCIFTSNSTIVGVGGGWFNNASNANPQLINCLFYGNYAHMNGAALTADSGHPVIINSTFYGNTNRLTDKGTINFLNNRVSLLNSIVWGNTGEGINRDGSGQLIVSHSLAQNRAWPQGTQDQGGNLLDRDPELYDPANFNFLPTPTSPVIDAGNNAHLPPDATTDLAGRQRSFSGSVDMGAFENQSAPSSVRYVKAGGTGDGFSWESASGNLQATIDASSPGHQVWVAAGEYRPAAGTSFSMKEGVKIYGGFAGTEQTLQQRNHRATLSILKGNGRSVVLVDNSQLTAQAVLDGFTVTGGEGTSGGGIAIHNGSPALSNLIVKGNKASQGGGIYIQYGSPTLLQVVISGNEATQGGGGLYLSTSTQQLTNVLISGNRSDNGPGGIYAYNATTTLTHTTIVSNEGNQYGSGIYAYGGTLNLRNSILHGNKGTREVSSVDEGLHVDGGRLSIVSSMIQGRSGNTDGNLDGNLDPGFTQPLPAGLHTGGDYSLQPNSWAVDAGNNAHLPQGLANDLAGNPRLFNQTVDMGAFESQVPPCTGIPLQVRVLPGSITMSGAQATWQAEAGAFFQYALSTSGSTPPATDALTDTQNNVVTFSNLAPTTTYYLWVRVLCDGSAPGRWVVSAPFTTLTIRYVKAGATGSGLSWAQASGDLQAIINASAPGDQVWVAAGEYQPDAGNSFSMKEGVKIYGGFSGTEHMLQERNHRTHVTTLTGNGNSVVRNDYNKLTAEAVLDGFTLTGGNAGSGGGIFNESVTPTLANLTIIGNKADRGGGISIRFSNHAPGKTLTLTNLIISGNEARLEGGGLYLNESTVELSNGLISGNQSGSDGGGIYSYISPLTLTHTTVTSNTAGNQGATIHQYGNKLTIRNSILYGNSSGNGESGIYTIAAGTLDVAHSLVQGRTGTTNGNLNGTTDPMFAGPLPAGLNVAGDYALEPGSPAVDAGNNGFLAQRLHTDLAGNTRNFNGTVDMGAFESQVMPCPAMPLEPHILPESITINSAVASWQAPTPAPDAGYRYGLSTSPTVPPASIEATLSTEASLENLTPGTTYYLWVRALCAANNPGQWVVSAPFTTLPAYIRYVKEGGTGDGLSWGSASGDLQAMLAVAVPGSEVRVAEGTYYPTLVQSGTNREKAFLLDKAIQVSGGYDAATGLRDPAANITILSGNIGNPDSETDNSYTVLHITADAALDGLTIRDGYANGPSVVIERTGAGIYNTGSPTVRNCIFTNNKAVGNGSNGIGAGWFNFDANANPLLVNCLFYGNYATSSGGALTADAGHPVIINSTFYGNTTVNTAKGTLNFLNNRVTLLNSIVSGNIGKGIHRDGSGQLTVSHSLAQDTGWPQGTQDQGNNLLARDPQLYDPANYNFTPIPSSPAVDAGNNNYLPQVLTTDLAGNQRIFSGKVDMGAFESQVAPCPASPTDLSITTSGAEASWQAPTPAPIAGYQYGLSTSATMPPTTTESTQATEASLQHLTPGTTYYLWVRALCAKDNPGQWVVSAPFTTLANRYYVKAGATGDGSSWEHASGDLQAMINASPAGGEVWVATGEYQPAAVSSFVMKEGVKIYGGFAGTEQTLQERNHRTNPSILKGNGNSVVNNDDNGLTAQAVLDGFTLTGGDAQWGGGIQNYRVSPTLANLTIIGNKAQSGGGIYMHSSSSTLTHITVSGNEAINVGGGLYLSNSSPQLYGMLISGNSSNYEAGGMSTRDSHLTLSSSTIAGNKATSTGGGLHHVNGTLAIRNSILHGNSTGSGESNLSSYNGSVSVENSLVQGYTGTENGNLPGTTDPMFVQPLPAGLNEHGDYSLQALSPAVDRGNNEHLPPHMAMDLGGNQRIFNGTVDMGAFESQVAACLASLTNLRILAESITMNSAEATWENATTTPIAGYQYGLSSSATVPPATGDFIHTTTPKAAFTTLNASTTYYLWVRALCEGNDPGNWLVSTPFTTLSYVGPKYVKAGATGDGLSWESASGDLQAIINASSPGDQIWVASGEYQPAAGTSFVMKEGVGIYGGFAGTEQALHERNHRKNITILRGNGNSVVRNHQNGLTAQAVLDGFTLTGGNTDKGGGINNYSSSPTLINLTISDNTAVWGGGIHLQNSNSPLSHVTVSGNEATHEGAGIYVMNSTILLSNVLVSGNLSANGAGGFYVGSSNLTLTNLTIVGNKASYEGAGIFHSNSTITLRNTILYGNNSGYGESGIFSRSAGNVSISYSLVQGHLATSNGNLPGSTDPLFTNPLPPGLHTGGDYSLQSMSPAVDAGSEAHLPSGLDSDLAGNPRIYRSTVDMGAYESTARTPLPITLIQFNARAEGGRTRLTWQTASERDNKEFILYRSTDGRNFAEIGRVAAAGTTSLRQDYSFWDEAPALGTNYYRLEQEDFDGTRERFSIRVVHHFQAADRLILSPNPTHGSVNAQFRAGKYSRAELLDLRGRVLQQVRIEQGTGPLRLDMQPYATGTYILKLTGEEGTITGKILKW